VNKLSNRRLARGFVAHLKTGKSPKTLIDMLAAEIVETKQISKVDLIVAEIAHELEVQMSTTNATVYSARQISNALKVEIKNLIKQVSGTDSVVLEEKIEPSLLGGVKIETPEREIDLSIRRKLETIGGTK
jgi:F-type H+-transporting ATPase subunit delta